tara:strand:- start:1675 stop:2289 length:615 start_codon:yes stop_codon:yes gene_type:complete
MSFNIRDFAGRLQFGGARPALFECNFTAPNSAGMQDLPFLCRATQTPPKTLTTVETQYFGRTIRFGGVQQFDTWTVTVINDEDFAIRNVLEGWADIVNKPIGNQRAIGPGSGAPGVIGGGTTEGAYKTDGQITQYGKRGNAIATYRVVGLFPTEVAAMDLDWATADAIQEFTVTFNIDYWHRDTVQALSDKGQVEADFAVTVST